MKSAQEAINEIQSQAEIEGLSNEWFFDFPFDDIKQLSSSDAADWLVQVLKGHQYADTYVSQFIGNLHGKVSQNWFDQLVSHPELVNILF